MKRALLLFLALVATGAPGIEAQGNCSVPHGSPGSVQSQGVGGLFPGAGWVQVSVFSLDTREEFTHTGGKEPYFNEGDLGLRSLLVTGAVGLIRGLEVWGQLSAHSVVFDESTGARESSGMGDARIWLRAGPELLGVAEDALPIWLGLRAGVKIPASEFSVDSKIIPLNEGQRDIDLAVEIGRTFADGRVVVQGWGGRRWRAENREAARRPGDEWFGYLSTTAAVGPVSLRVAAQSFSGDGFKSNGFAIPSGDRNMFEVFPSVIIPLGRGAMEVGARIPVVGKNLPAGNALTIGYSLGWGGSPEPDVEALFPER